MKRLPRHPAADIGQSRTGLFTCAIPLTTATVMPEGDRSLRRPMAARAARWTKWRPLNAILCTHGYTASTIRRPANPANGNSRARGTA